jgi:enoyl-CoA hydratase/carnithine racemase
MSDSTLSYERRGAIAIVAIDAPPHNPMSLAFMDALESLVADIAADPGIRSVVMTASGEQNFSVGMNLKQLVASLGDWMRSSTNGCAFWPRSRTWTSPGSQRFSVTA